MRRLTAALALTVPTAVLFAWTSPGTGLCYTPDGLVAASGGALVGSWPEYQQQQDLLISPGDSLRWPAGLVWRAAPGVELRVSGAMLALGTPWEPVLATSQDGLPGGWSGLILDEAAESLLRRVVLSGADDGLNCLGSSPTVEYCELTGNFDSGLHCFLGGNPVLRHCLVEGNSRYGVEITGGSSPVLEHCVIRGNNVQGASPLNAVAVGIQGTNSPRLVSCRLEGLGPANPASGFSQWLAGDPLLADCEIVGFRSGVVIQGTGAAGRLERCWIHSNRYSNPIQGGSGINVNGAATPVFRGCQIEDNDWGVTLTSVCAPDFGTTEDFGLNHLHGNGNGGAVWDFYNNTSGDVDAAGNWWGTDDTVLIEEHIHDAQDGAFGSVDIFPILVDPLEAPWLSPGLGWAALDAGQVLALRPADRFRQVAGLSYFLEGPGEVEVDGDSLRWTPPADGDTLVTLLLRAELDAGPVACDTLRVWLRRDAAPGLALELAWNGPDLELAWSAMDGALAYRLERCPDGRFLPADTVVLQEGPQRAATDADALPLGRAFYRVVAVLPD